MTKLRVSHPIGGPATVWDELDRVKVLAVDWSGRARRAERFLWTAEARDGRLCDLRGGLGREAAIERIMALAREEPETVVGLDFAFSFPAWWCAHHGWRDVHAVWAAMQADGERLLAACDPPFWGRPGHPNPNPGATGFRQTELADARGAKSVFQIGGAGAVGTGSVRGMPHLARLAGEGFSVWPFHRPGWPRVVEIYPRAMTGPVIKRSGSARHAYLHDRFPEQPPLLLQRAAGSEDAFDAAVSALVMSRHAEQLARLTAATDGVATIEGRIWRPGATTSGVELPQ